MLRNFFALNAPFEKFDAATLMAALKTSKHICNVLYEPDLLERVTVSGVKFENVSFSKTRIHQVTFTDCTFVDCLFIGTELDSVEFHGCTVSDCNFFKSKFKSVYAKPHQFRGAIKDNKFSNIAVHLYHQLRENYYQESQREFKNEAEYYFAVWNRKNEFSQAKRRATPWHKHMPQHVASFLYDHLLGYGYRVRNLVVTTLIMLALTIWANYSFAHLLFEAAPEPSLLKTIYFTLTTMATLGSSGYSPNTDIGYIFVVVNVLFGISVLSATVTAIFKKVIR